MAGKNLREFVQDISENIELGEEFKIEDIPEVELPKNFNDDFHKKYLTILSAKNNTELMGHFKGKYLSSFDLKTKNGFIANGGTEEEFNELKAQEPDSLKLVDLVFDKVKERKSLENPPKNDNKEFEKYKADTAKQIEKLLGEKEEYESNLESVVSDVRKKFIGEIRNEKISSRLNGKTYNNGMDKKDAIFLTMRRVDESDYILALDENRVEKVYDKNNPEMEAIVDGKSIDWDYVLDHYSQTYTEKNTQTPTPQVREVRVPVQDNGQEDGRYISGHKDYGKK